MEEKKANKKRKGVRKRKTKETTNSNEQYITLTNKIFISTDYAAKLSNHLKSIQERLDLNKYKIQDISFPTFDLKPLRVLETKKEHGFLSALRLAFSNHHPILISPDMIWLLISQGLAKHINKNSEKLKKRFRPENAEKSTIEVRRDDFIHGSGHSNPWEEVFSEFSKKIKEHIGEKAHSLILGHFSTSGVTEIAASEIVLMDSMQSYFRYIFRTKCGIPAIVLRGTVEDWDSIKTKILRLQRGYGLKKWVNVLVPIIEMISKSASGKLSKKNLQEFWGSIYKKWNIDGSGGGPVVSGWILNFFPYIGMGTTESPNKIIAPWEHFASKKKKVLYVDDGVFTLGIASAPFIWEYYLENFEMEFLGGFTGVGQEGNTIIPIIGWAIIEKIGERKPDEPLAKEEEI